MLKAIGWLAWALLMCIFCVMHIANGDICFAVIAGLTGIMNICLFIFELRERKRLKKLEDEWESLK